MAYAYQDELLQEVCGDEGQDAGAGDVGGRPVRQYRLSEDRRALEALLAAVPPEMAPTLADKETVKNTWNAITVARISSDRARRATLQKLRQEVGNLAIKLGEDVDDFALRLTTLIQQLVWYNDDDIDEESRREVPSHHPQVHAGRCGD